MDKVNKSARSAASGSNRTSNIGGSDAGTGVDAIVQADHGYGEYNTEPGGPSYSSDPSGGDADTPFMEVTPLAIIEPEVVAATVAAKAVAAARKTDTAPCGCVIRDGVVATPCEGLIRERNAVAKKGGLAADYPYFQKDLDAARVVQEAHVIAAARETA